MPGQTQPPHDQFRQQLSDIEHRLQGVEHQQQMVITDPTGASGDPAHGHAVMVTGSLKAICGIAAFGCAVWSGSAWVQVPTGLAAYLGLGASAPAAGGTYTDAGAAVVHAGGTFTGAIGSSAYTINQIVTALKLLTALPL